MESSRTRRGAKVAALVLLAVVLAVGNGAGLAKKGGKHKGANNGVTVVTPKKLHGWGFYNDQIDEPIDPDFSTGPGQPPRGDGSAHLAVVSSTEGKILSAHIFNGVQLRDFKTLQFSTYQTDSSGGASPSLQLGIDFDPKDDKTDWQGRLVYVPGATQEIKEGEWQTWDALDDRAGTGTGNWFFTQSPGKDVCGQGNLCTLAEVLAAFPTIRIHPQGPDQNNGAGLGFIGFKVGSGDSNLDANVDKLIILVKHKGKSIYDFEP